VLEDGRLTDNYGNVIDFTNTLIIMTSNLGSRDLAAGDGMGFVSQVQSLESARVREIVDREVRRHFPPEFTNRLDDVIVFEPLSEDSLLAVAKLLLGETSEILARRRISLEYDSSVPRWVLERMEMDPQAGARPLRRLVKLWIEDTVADYLIRHRSEGEIQLRVRLVDDAPVVESVAVVPSVQEDA